MSADPRGPRPGRRRGSSRSPLWALLLACVLGACGCPPPLQDYTAPERTLASWQSSLCRDQAQEEYACLARSFHDAIGGFGNYHAWRRHLLDTEPLMAALLKRAEIDADDIVASARSPDGDHAELVVSVLGERVELAFDREVWVTLVWSDGRARSFRQPDTFTGLLHLTDMGQWLQLAHPALDPDAAATLEAVHFDTRWLLAGFRPTPPLP